SWKKWKKSFLKVGFKSFEDIKYIRYYLPFSYKGRNAEDMIAKENIKVTNAFLRKYFFFGLCFIAEKN
ncbi:hypothetical protein LJC69_06485, partial [Bacteroidales bacterium OttesenSCG-928-K22]|nr:hypothetical protein [Bacteroidales bacterium OttesenSCG-928-K22]